MKLINIPKKGVVLDADKKEKFENLVQDLLKLRVGIDNEDVS